MQIIIQNVQILNFNIQNDSIINFKDVQEVIMKNITFENNENKKGIGINV